MSKITITREEPKVMPIEKITFNSKYGEIIAFTKLSTENVRLEINDSVAVIRRETMLELIPILAEMVVKK